MYTACLIFIHSAFCIIVLGPFTSIHDYVILIIGQYYKYDNTFWHTGSLWQMLVIICLYVCHEALTVSFYKGLI